MRESGTRGARLSLAAPHPSSSALPPRRHPPTLSPQPRPPQEPGLETRWVRPPWPHRALPSGRVLPSGRGGGREGGSRVPAALSGAIASFGLRAGTGGWRGCVGGGSGPSFLPSPGRKYPRCNCEKRLSALSSLSSPPRRPGRCQGGKFPTFCSSSLPAKRWGKAAWAARSLFFSREMGGFCCERPARGAFWGLCKDV